MTALPYANRSNLRLCTGETSCNSLSFNYVITRQSAAIEEV